MTVRARTQRLKWLLRRGPAPLGLALAVGLSACGSGPGEPESRARGATSPAHLLFGRGLAYESQDSLLEAMHSYDSCIALATGAEADSLALFRCLAARMQLHLELALHARAEADARTLLGFRRGAPAPAHCSSWLVLALCHERESRLASADSATDSALRWASTPPVNAVLHAEAFLARGRAHMLLERAALAESCFAAAVALSAPDALPRQQLEAQSLLGWSMARQGRLAEAEPLLLRAYAGIRTGLDETDARVRTAAGRVAELYERWQKPDLAAHYRRVATSDLPPDEWSPSLPEDLMPEAGR